MNIPIAEPSIGPEELANVMAAVESAWVSSLGRFIGQFEAGFATYCGVKHGVATANGTTALHLALTALGIGKGHEVIIPSLTFIATANSVTYTGATPVCVDSHPDYWCMDPAALESRITPRTRAIIPVHLYGHPCDMDWVLAVAKSHGLYVVEDAAEAHGAEYRHKRTGSFGHVACFSFFGNKIITTGEGGMCLTDDDGLAQTMRILRDHGTTPGKPYWHDVVGFNYRMTNLQAAVGVAQLHKIEAFIEKKRLLAGWYTGALQGLYDSEKLQGPPQMPWAKNVYWMYTILINDAVHISRNEAMALLRDRGIETRPVFYPVEAMSMYSAEDKSPVAEAIARRGLCLPSSVNLTAEHVDYVAEALRDITC